jgi:hypothetical protein
MRTVIAVAVLLMLCAGVRAQTLTESLVERGFACDWERFSGGYYSRNGKGRLCPPDHRRTCAAVAPQVRELRAM